jgi:hypothetical protein
MKPTTPRPVPRLVHGLGLRISTRIRLHREFVKSPTSFACRLGVDLVKDVSPEMSFAKSVDGEKTTKVRANIHLVRHGAIRLFTERADGADWIRSIDLNPALLLHGPADHLSVDHDLPWVLHLCQGAVTPLLADPRDRGHVIPGLVANSENRAYWSRIKSLLRLPGIQIPGLHGVSHPDAGPPDGPDDKRLQLGKNDDDCVIAFEAAAGEGRHNGAGVDVSLSLKRRALLAAYQTIGKVASVLECERLVAFRASDVAKVHREVMSRLTGIYLPVAPEWADTGKDVTPAKITALLSKITPIPLDELCALDVELRNPSLSTLKRLKRDLSTVDASLKPVPVSSLFRPRAYAACVVDHGYPVGDRCDPRIAAVYGPDPFH